MKSYQEYLEMQGVTVKYVNSYEKLADIREFVQFLSEASIEKIYFVDPVDDWLNKRIRSACAQCNMTFHVYDSPMFLNSGKEREGFFTNDKQKFLQADFYVQERKKRKLLLEVNDNPAGGKWSYDEENRKRYPRNKKPPLISFPQSDNHYKEAIGYVEKFFPGNLGIASPEPLQPFTYNASRKWLAAFLEFRFHEFGPYEDAIVKDEHLLHHSKLTPMLNTGLISPDEVVTEVLRFAATNSVPLNSTEGFLRQIIGWREFVRGMYIARGVKQRTTNFWNFHRKVPDSFYEGNTGVEPFDATIQKVLKTGYCHHIERLMILGNFMLLCEIHPDEVYRWFMELFVDAYDWVMVPNVYGMSQFADGGLMTTKPYISGSNYILKMSDYKKGEWQKPWDALFWRFMHVHREVMIKNSRIGMLVNSFDKMPQAKRKGFLKTAGDFLESLDR